MVLVSPEKIEQYTRAGWWGHQTLWDQFVHNRAAHPHTEAVVDACNRSDFAHGAPRRLTWDELGDEIDRFSTVLLAQGLRKRGHDSRAKTPCFLKSYVVVT